MAKGFVYLAAVIDWFSRRVLAWRVSITMETSFCIEAVEEALQRYGAPEIFNTDQGSQFTSEAFTGLLQPHSIRISLDGKGSYNDKLFIERLWRSVKSEEVYLKAYQDGRDASISPGNYFRFYNTERPHQALAYRTPAEVFTSISVEVSNGDVVESLRLDPLRIAEPNLNSPILF
jgi:putative transposase